LQICRIFKQFPALTLELKFHNVTFHIYLLNKLRNFANNTIRIS
jgi:hypothetical protein